MGDFQDEDDDPNYTRHERLENQYYAMQEMLDQLKEAKASKENPSRHGRGRGFNQDNRRNRRGEGGREPDGRGDHERNWRQPVHPWFNSENYREPGRMGYEERRGYYTPGRGRGQPVHYYRQRNENLFDRQPSLRHGNEGQRIMPQFLVETLIGYPDYSCSLLQLLEQKKIQPKSVREVASNHPKIFSLMNEKVELKPQIGICANHCGTEGCLDPSCDELHICNQYIMERCQDKNCVLGHNWQTGRNSSILQKYYMKQLPSPALLKLLQGTGKCNIKTTEPLILCHDYNGEGCKENNCTALHLCQSFVSELTKCKNSDCELNHDPLEQSCSQLLENHGFATNEAPRDIIVALVTSNPSLRNEITKENPKKQKTKSSSKSSKKEESGEAGEGSTDSDQTKPSSKTSGKERNSPKKARLSISETSSSGTCETNSESESDSQSSHDEQEDLTPDKPTIKSPAKVRTSKPAKVSTKATEVMKPEIHTTLWSHYLKGDVPIPEICYYSVESSCRYEGSGCQRLHATKHFHWQICDQNNRWLNLRPEQLECLEHAYCDPDEDGVELPLLNPTTLERSLIGLVILMGRDTWISDFKAMTLTNSSKSKAFRIRRLCTQTIDGEVIKPSVFMWYFSDKNGEWVQYGNVDTAGATHLVSSITSDGIEKQFMRDPNSSVSFNNSKFTYFLDFKTMTQMNLKTKVVRNVTRRPAPHIQEEENEEEAKTTTNDLPDTWEKMQPEERMRLVTLGPSSSEYQTVVTLLNGRITSNIMKIQRIQNPFLWRAFENKIQEMTTIYKDATQVNVRQLFHGTSHNIVSNICAENFDWRLHGTKSGQSYGRGTYFATDPSYSYGYANPDGNNLRYMFIARVAVGSVTGGNSGMARPPINPRTSQPFDSTVDNVSSPSITVKYDKQEYYPEYLLTLS